MMFPRIFPSSDDPSRPLTAREKMEHNAERVRIQRSFERDMRMMHWIVYTFLVLVVAAVVGLAALFVSVELLR